MSEIHVVDAEATDPAWAMLAVARDVETSEAWQDALEAEGIASEVRLEDAVITGRSSATTYANGPGLDQLFSYALWVPASDRDAAAAALIDAGWDGRYGRQSAPSMSASYVVRGTLVALAAGALFVAVLLRAGG